MTTMSARKRLIIGTASGRFNTFPGRLSASDTRLSQASPDFQKISNTTGPTSSSLSNITPQKVLGLHFTPIRSLTEKKRRICHHETQKPEKDRIKRSLIYNSSNKSERNVNTENNSTSKETRKDLCTVNSKASTDKLIDENGVLELCSWCSKSLMNLMLTAGIVILVMTFFLIIYLFITKLLVFTSSRQYGRFNVTELTTTLSENVFGQHIAVRMISNAISDFLAINKTVLVLSFHGSTGVGKSYVSNLMTAMNGVVSIKFHTQIHFTHTSEDALYSVQIESWILSNSTRCNTCIFVVDEFDEATPGVLKGLHTALNKLERRQNMLEIDGYRIIVLTISNSGGKMINSHTLKHTMDEHTRDTIHVHELVKKIVKALPNLERQFYSLLGQSGISHHIIPFLPLEKQYVHQCIDYDLRKKHKTVNSKIVEDVAKQLIYYHVGKNMFAKSGCKSVSIKVDLLT